MDATELVMKWISLSLEEVLGSLSDKPIGYVVLLVEGPHTAVVSNLGVDLSTEVLREHVKLVELMAAKADSQPPIAPAERPANRRARLEGYRSSTRQRGCG